MLDPYAKAISGTLQWHDALFGYEVGDTDEDLSFSTTDSAPYIPKSVVVNDQFSWENDSNQSGELAWKILPGSPPMPMKSKGNNGTKVSLDQ